MVQGDGRVVPGLFGGSAVRESAPAPSVIMIPDRKPEIPTVQPFFGKDDNVRKLAFTGRGVGVAFGQTNVTVDANDIRRLKFGPLPFWGLVRKFHWAWAVSSSAVSMMPIYSLDDDVSSITALDGGKDHRLVLGAETADTVMDGLGSQLAGAIFEIGLDFLLPLGDVYLGLHLWNSSAATRTMMAWFEVREVIAHDVDGGDGGA